MQLLEADRRRADYLLPTRIHICRRHRLRHRAHLDKRGGVYAGGGVVRAMEAACG